ncbi:hypothetical protein PUR61_03365 [Streptomyces sp. BE20]|uniref:hypothetical protein n=1 Tax=Streptomyces sp. BE20 TaxID=3002525 RepID=UPI002E792DAF|nr:hypothetical protein [Streptomyces sp. BE20]MEE1821242.1 hypothetical protein [Streptomyces sp. BE20]
MLSGAAGRIVLDGYSWMQAVHWVHGAGLYVPPARRPKFSETTLRLARILSELTPCRPGIAHLMRAMQCSRRTVQYHLEILRATGLLAWRSVGTRLPMIPGQVRVDCRASEYERLIPVSYDQALGIRTAGEGVERRMTGISTEGRSVIAELGRKAAKKVRRTRRTPRHIRARQPPGTSRCTPMEGGTTTYVSSSSMGDSKATGEARVKKSITREQRTAKPARPSRQGRRTVLGQVVTAAMMAAGDSLARLAYRRLPWVRAASHDQLRWVCNDLTNRGWSEDRALAWLAEVAAQYPSIGGLLWRPERPHALIAHALREEAEQHVLNEQLWREAAAQVDPMDNAELREFRELTALFDLMPQPNAEPVVERAGTSIGEACFYPQAAAALMEADPDTAIDRYGADLVGRFTYLAASPTVQLGGRGR